MVNPEEYIDSADESVEQANEQPFAINEYIDRLFDNSTLGAHSARYILDAIESMGKRTVIEEGEELDRWCFFDDPHNDGEHAILGNTETLNALVDDIRSIASGLGKEEKIIWVSGPTGTGKSELKRCLISGLREYSKTPEGRRYTLEWNVSTVSGTDTAGMTYGDNQDANDGDWYESPVQTHPLSVFPESVREGIIDDVNAQSDKPVPINPRTDLDPFSREAYEYLEDTYVRKEVDEPFSAITHSKHLRVKNYVVDIGQGIGVLHTEDDGSVKERLVGSWMPGMFDDLESRGRKDPQAFSYDGVLSQGNGILTVVEDGAQHTKLLTKLLNVPDEEHVKLDRAIGMDIDTMLMVISNPDLESTLNNKGSSGNSDKLRALRRRLDKKRFDYLTNVTLEAQLLRREVTNDYEVWGMETYDSTVEKMEEPVSVSVSTDDGSITEREFAPHAIEAAAVYDVITRLNKHTILTLVEKAKLFDQGYLEDRADEVYEIDDFTFNSSDGERGIPVTFTRDVISELLNNETDRVHEVLDVESVIMPSDVIEAMADSLETAPMFDDDEITLYDSRLEEAETWVFRKQSEDVLDAVLADEKLDTETVNEYIRHVYAQGVDDQVDGKYGSEDPDTFVMKVFETEHLGKFDEDDYDGTDASETVLEFREDEIVSPINRRTWERRDDGFTLDDIDFWDLPAIRDELTDYDWQYVKSNFDNLEPEQWADPPENTETESVKEKAMKYLVDEHGYSPASAELVSRKVFREVSDKWD
jgi:predicted Ser/Thr protein kinase